MPIMRRRTCSIGFAPTPERAGVRRCPTCWKAGEVPGKVTLTNELEASTAHRGRRSVNYDPGYLEAAKLVLATTKNFDHRLYLGNGIYGDVQLRFRKGAFAAMDWTYPDYQQQSVLDFFHLVRSWYLRRLAFVKGRSNDNA